MAADVGLERVERIRVLTGAELAEVAPSLRDIIVIGCPLDCAYCVRHFQQNFDMKRPHLLCDDETAVATLVGHRYFQPHVTPVQAMPLL